ncbi:PEP-CTERM sorting domain-containing protein [Aeoliella sp. ICT_H6.2]|uniref:PEP-CTERM sorting domain-containing protein n=1 Tax=Aeoliella straminimaris TaxID=2954799 RepID=A0A9X2JDX4_9BACT|nr:PEP-CTERM sorting domain-containing protein [Aeoliella straminimaris]MCO6042385.1 PEP-CTERM sorting domain-containing protein [Aeoliella straminimaris]
MDGKCCSERSADFNGDGLAGVDIGDFEIWKSYFGESARGEDSIAPSAVPEPSSVALLVLAIATVAGRFARRQQLRR